MALVFIDESLNLFKPVFVEWMCSYSFYRELFQYSAFDWKSFYKPPLRAVWLNRCSRIWRSRVQSPAHFWLKQSHLFRGLCPREMASWGQTPFFWSSERMLVCRTVGLSPLFEFNQKNVCSQNNWTRRGGVRAKWQNFRTRIPLLWVRCQLKLFILVFGWKKKSFSNAVSSPLSARNSKIG